MSNRKDEFDGRPELVKKRARSNFLLSLSIWGLVIFMTAGMTLLVVNAVQGAQTRGILVDCTDPEGDCYQEGQDRTAVLIQQLIDANSLGDVATQRVVVLAAACSEEDEVKAETNQAKRIRLLEICVNEQLELDHAEGR